MDCGCRAWFAALSLTACLAAGGAAVAAPAGPGESGAQAPPSLAEPSLRALLDAPLLFIKRRNFKGYHIYDTFYKWGPGGGIYILENPADPPERHRVRPLLDPTTPETLGEGMYDDPELSWDARRLLFTFKGEPKGSTSIYEIGTDGRGLRRLSDPSPYCRDYCGNPSFGGMHDLCPAYLPDGRIVFLSTRAGGLVPCFNVAVATLHVMNADGSGIHSISVNNVNEFDPAVLEDGRILFGRWEYVDKTALTQQSLWTVFPDGTGETALFANNLVKPEALLDARPVPGSHLVAATLSCHNAPPRGTVAFIDPQKGKNDPAAIANLDAPGDPTLDRGDSCDPWPLSDQALLYSGRAQGAASSAILLADRAGRREVIYADPSIDCHAPMLLKPRPVPPVLAASTGPGPRGRFLVQDVYQGLAGVRRGEVKHLRVIEETARVSESHGGGPFNQTHTMSGVLGWSAKVFWGLAPVESDGSAYFEAPAGRALYFQALDAEGRLVQSMRTFVQAAPGTTRACIGCHEYKYAAPVPAAPPLALKRGPSRLESESWGNGYLDYPTMVQPVLDRRCVRCHGGEGGIAARLDLSGGWTEYFNISYENLVSRRRTQVTADLISGIDCMNGTSLWSAQIFLPRSHGSGAAPLAEVLVSGHKGRIPDLARRQRDLVLAWVDTNGLYHGTWDRSPDGCRLAAWARARGELLKVMQAAGCARCHGEARQARFEGDWFNLRTPEWSRILRAPMAKEKGGLGLALCRDRPVDGRRRRVAILLSGYAHAVTPVENFRVPQPWRADDSGEPVVTLASTADPHYQAMLDIIRRARQDALAHPRRDMPGATILPGRPRRPVDMPLAISPP